MEPTLKLLTADQTARQLMLSRSAVYSMIARRELPSIRLGKSIRVPATALADWLEERMVHPKKEDDNHRERR